MGKIYILQATLTFVKSLIGIFVPVYLFSLGFSLAQVGIYTLLMALTSLILLPISSKVINLIGYKYTILLSLPIYILHIFFLQYILDFQYLVYFVGILYGFYASLFWPAYNYEVSQCGSNKHRANEIGTLQIIITLVSSLSPLIGGFFLEFLSYGQLLIFSISILLTGFIPFIFSKNINLKKEKITIKQYYDSLNIISNKNKIIFLAEGLEFSISVVFWPIMIFILLDNSFVKLGFLFSLVSIISVIFITYLKSYVDSHRKEKVLKSVLKTISVNWFLRGIMFLFFFPLIYFVESFQKLLNSIYGLSFSSIFYNNVSKISYGFKYILIHDFYVYLGRIIACSIVIILTFFYELKIIFLILIIFGILIPSILGKYREGDL